MAFTVLRCRVPSARVSCICWPSRTKNISLAVLVQKAGKMQIAAQFIGVGPNGDMPVAAGAYLNMTIHLFVEAGTDAVYANGLDQFFCLGKQLLISGISERAAVIVREVIHAAADLHYRDGGFGVCAFHADGKAGTGQLHLFIPSGLVVVGRSRSSV